MRDKSNDQKGSWKVFLLLSSMSLGILIIILGIAWFFNYRTMDKFVTFTYDGNKYYSTAYIGANLSYDEPETTIFGGANYIGSYKETEFDIDRENKLWSIKGIPQKRLLIEMTPDGQGASMRTWVSRKLKNAKEAFDFLNPKYLSYLDYDGEKMITKQMEYDKQKEVIRIMRQIIEKKPNFTRMSTVQGESVHEIYFNNDKSQSIVLQASLLRIDNGKVYMSVAGDMGRICYWEVNDELLKLLI
ncbi:hypothetical protein [Lactococcus garvieae]